MITVKTAASWWPVMGTAKGKATFEVTYQCCDDQICFPPTTKTVEVR